jgi:histidine triad (HIT) family protein
MTDCKICNIINKKAQGKVIYEDAAVMAIMSDEPTIFGHLLVFPKNHHATLEEVDDKVVAQMFYVASYAATAIFEGLGAEGTNIIISNGKDSSQRYSHIVLDVLPRKTNDGLDFKWEPKKLTPEDMDGAMEKIKDKADEMDYQGEDKPKVSGEKKTAPSSLDEDNYIVRHLRRIP